MRYVIFLFLMFLPQYAFAYCDEYIYENTKDDFEYTFACDNTFSGINYDLIRSYSNNLDFEYLKLNVENSDVICTRVLSDGKELIAKPCRQYGLQILDYSESINGVSVNFKQFNSVEFLKVEFTDLYENNDDVDFIYPENVSDIDGKKCIAAFNEDAVNIFFIRDLYWPLSECLFQLEAYLTEKKKTGGD